MTHNTNKIRINTRVVYLAIGLFILTVSSLLLIKLKSKPHPLSTEQHEAAQAAELQLIMGGHVMNSVGDQWHALSIPSSVAAKDCIKTDRDRRNVIALPDGSSLRLDSHTCIGINSVETAANKGIKMEAVLYYGAIFIDENSGSTVSVRTGDAQIIPYSTRFGVKQIYKNGRQYSIINVIDGSVKAINLKNNKTVEVYAGQQAEVSEQILTHNLQAKTDKWIKWNAKWHDINSIPAYSKVLAVSNYQEPAENDGEEDGEEENEADSGIVIKTHNNTANERSSKNRTQPAPAEQKTEKTAGGGTDYNNGFAPALTQQKHNQSAELTAEQKAALAASQRQKEYNLKRQAQQRKLEAKAKEQEEQEEQRLAKEQQKNRGKQTAVRTGKKQNAGASYKPQQKTKKVKGNSSENSILNSDGYTDSAANPMPTDNRTAEEAEAVSAAETAARSNAEDANFSPNDAGSIFSSNRAAYSSTAKKRDRRRRRAGHNGLESSPNPLDAKIGGMQDMEAKIAEPGSLDATIAEPGSLDAVTRDDWSY